MRLKAASWLLLPSCKVLGFGQQRWHHLQIGSTKVTLPLDQVNQGYVFFSLGQPRLCLLQLGSTKVMSPSDRVNHGDVTFRSGQPRWRHLQIRSTKMTLPSDRVNPSGVTFRSGQPRWHQLQVRSTKVTSPSDSHPFLITICIHNIWNNWCVSSDIKKNATEYHKLFLCFFTVNFYIWIFVLLKKKSWRWDITN